MSKIYEVNDMGLKDSEFDEVYNRIKNLHKTNFPKLRIGQLFCALQIYTNNDLFYCTNEELLNKLWKMACGVKQTEDDKQADDDKQGEDDDEEDIEECDPV